MSFNIFQPTPDDIVGYILTTRGFIDEFKNDANIYAKSNPVQHLY